LSLKRSLILYGNCQADAMTSTLRLEPIVSGFYDVAYFRSFDHPSEGRMSFDDRITRRCELLWEQHDPQTFPQTGLLPRDCLSVKFPAADFNLLWPFNCVNPYNAPEPPTYPFGRYAYGDRVIANAIDRGMNPDDILEYYLNAWDDYKVDLDRLLQLETARINARDARCDVKIGDFVLKRFRKERLFWTVNHPTPVLLRELIERLLQFSDPVQPVLADADVVTTLSTHFRPEGPLGIVGIPIHPKVAEHLELEWYDPNERYHSWDGKTYSYVEYFEGMIRQAIRVRAEGTAAPTLAR
jgi:Polysaccharide biosynthesis enzyme WcbI